MQLLGAFVLMVALAGMVSAQTTNVPETTEVPPTTTTTTTTTTAAPLPSPYVIANNGDFVISVHRNATVLISHHDSDEEEIEGTVDLFQIRPDLESAMSSLFSAVSTEASTTQQTLRSALSQASASLESSIDSTAMSVLVATSEDFSASLMSRSLSLETSIDNVDGSLSSTKNMLQGAIADANSYTDDVSSALSSASSTLQGAIASGDQSLTASVNGLGTALTQTASDLSDDIGQVSTSLSMTAASLSMPLGQLTASTNAIISCNAEGLLYDGTDCIPGGWFTGCSEDTLPAMFALATGCDNTVFNGECELNCKSPTETAGLATCGANGRWIVNEEPTCTITSCRDLVGSASGFYNIDVLGTTTRVYCNMESDPPTGSIFYTDSATAFSFSSRACVFNYGNDDHDSTTLWVDLTAKIAYTNTYDATYSYYYTYTRSRSEVRSAQYLDHRYSGMPVGNVYIKPVPFPAADRVVWIVGSTLRYNNVVINVPTCACCAATQYPRSVIITDGISEFYIGYSGNYCTASYIRMQWHMDTAIVESAQSVSVASDHSTEQDAFGHLLWTVNGRPFMYETNTLNRFTVGQSLKNPFADKAYMTSSGWSAPYNTQFGMDLFGFVDTSGYLWFGDWGHDNGGYFNCGNDNYYGIARTTIRLTDNTIQS